MPKTHIRTRRTHPLNALRAFEAAARLGRVSAAADELGVTHGAVSRQVRQLEQSSMLSCSRALGAGRWLLWQAHVLRIV
jgi:DNA-binding MarR family transcriptional regulator